MRDRKLKRKLRALTIPQYDFAELENTITKAKEIQFHPEKQRMTTRQFFQDQIRFIRKEFWGMKLILTAFLLYLILSEGIDADSWLWTFVAISGPILCMANANVLCDVCQPGMLELQMTARHSLHEILMFRLMVSGAVDLLAFTAGTAVMILWKDVYLWQIFLYAWVPYNLMCLGCLAVLNRKNDENALPYCMTWGIAIVFVMIVFKGYQLFEVRNAGAWMMLGTVSALGVIRETKKLIQFKGAVI